MIDRRIYNIIIYCRPLMSNAVADDLNSEIMAIEWRAGVDRYVWNFKEVMYF